MNIINDLGEKFEINIFKYYLEDHYNQAYSSDWLDAELNLSIGDENFTVKLEFLTLEELERMQYWLQKVIDLKEGNKTLLFVDPNLKFKVMTRSNIKVLKVIYENAFEEIALASWELIITKQNLLFFIDQIREDLQRFPCRCNQRHDIEETYV